MKKTFLLFSAVLAFGFQGLHAQFTCGTATAVTPGTYTAPVITGTGATELDANGAVWYSFTPSSVGNLTISSCGGGADTRLWIRSGTCGALTAVANNDDSPGCISSGTDEYASRVQNLVLQSGVTYYFEWDDRWGTPTPQPAFSWSFTFTAIPNNGDAGITTRIGEYARMPITQLSSVPLTARIQNNSVTPLTNVVVTAEVFTTSNLTTPVATFSSAPISLGSTAVQTVSIGTWTPPANVADYVINFTKTQTEADAVTSNNTGSQTFTVDFNYYGRDNGVLAGALGAQTGGNIRMGSQFTVINNDQITGVQYYINTTNAAQQYNIQIYQVTGGVMGATPLYTSPTQTTTGIAGFNTLNFTPLAVTPGEYAVILHHTSTANVNIGLGYSNNIFTAGKQWLKITTGAWQNADAQGFNIAFMIRPKFGVDAANDVRFVSNSQTGEYSAIHAIQAPTGTPLTFGAVGRNGGTASATNVVLTVNVRNSANTVVYTAASAPQTLATLTNGTFTVPSFLVTATGEYTIEYAFSADGTDEIPNNNSGTTTFERSLDFMSRAVGITGSLGVGPNTPAGVYDGAVLGQTYTLTQADELKSVRFVLNAPPANVPVRVDIYNTTAGVPTGTPIASTTVYTTTTADNTNGVELNLPISGGTLNLAAGTYYFGVIEQEGNITLATSTKNFTTGKTFLKWDANAAGAWVTNESFNFNVVYVLDPVFNVCLPVATTFDVTNANCSAADGSAEVTATGGTGGFTYLWDNGQNTAVLSNVASGVYEVTITDALGCETVAEVTIQDQSTLTATAAVTNVTCANGNNGSITVTPASGQTPYTYTWAGSPNTTPTLVNLTAGTYTATVTDGNGCTFIISQTVTQPTAVSATAAVTNVVCAGGATGSITLTPAGGNGPYTYAWTGSTNTTATLSGLVAGSYAATVTDNNGCTVNISQTVTETGTPLTVTAVVNNPTGFVNITPAGGTAPYTYLWSNGVTTQDLFGVSSGTYTVTITDANGCETTGSFTVANTISINEAEAFGELKIFPNPSNGNFNVSIQIAESKNVRVELINVVGKTLMTQTADNITSHVFNFDVAGYAAGIYTVRITANGQSTTKVIIIQ